MLLSDPLIGVAALATLLRSEFDTEAELSFVPVGGDSWNYRAGAWWVSVRRDRQGHFPGSYEAARQLREAGHAFVLAPCRGRSGRVVFLVGGRPVVVSPFVAHHPSSGLSPRETEALRQAAESLHSATVSAPVPRETFELPFAAELDAALSRAEAGASGSGPFGGDVSSWFSATVSGSQRGTRRSACASSPAEATREASF